MMQQYTQEECAARLAEAQAYYEELRSERFDVTPLLMSSAQKEIQKWRMWYNASLIGDVDDWDAEIERLDALVEGLDDDH
jgi:hypothetical protein